MAPFVSFYAKRPLSEWIEDLQQAASAEDRYRALQAVNSVGSFSEAIRWCRHGLNDADSGVRALAAKQLGDRKRLADQSPPETQIADWPEVRIELEQRLVDDDPDVRFEAARALGQVNPQSTLARDVLLALLDAEGTQPLMLAVVVSALGERRNDDPVSLISRLRKLLGHSQAEVRENASAVAARLPSGTSDLVPELIVALDDDEPIVRENAAISLGRAGNNSPDVMAALSAAGQDEDEGVAAAARDAQSSLSNNVAKH